MAISVKKHLCLKLHWDFNKNSDIYGVRKQWEYPIKTCGGVNETDLDPTKNTSNMRHGRGGNSNERGKAWIGERC